MEGASAQAVMDVGDQLSMRGDMVAQRYKEMVPFDTRKGTPDTAG